MILHKVREDDATKERRVATGNDGPTNQEDREGMQECESFFLSKPSIARYAGIMRKENTGPRKITDGKK